jgi:uncharacterized membrane protein YbhN (UPF0104 family)
MRATATAHGGWEVHIEPEELLLSARARRPEALIRSVIGLALIGLTLLLAHDARSTAGGLDADVAQLAAHAPKWLVDAAGAFAATAVLVLPVAFAARLLLQREPRRAADGVLAAVPAYGLALLVGLAHPVLDRPAPVLAYLVTAGAGARPRWLAATVVLLGLDGLTALVNGSADALALLLSLLVGLTAANAAVYALGSPNARLTLELLFSALRQTGFRPATATRTPGAPPHEQHRFLVSQADGRPDLDVMLLDRETSASGFFRRTWRRVRLRTAPQRRSLLSPRGALQQEALLSYAAQAAGARSRRLLLTADLGPDAAFAVYARLTGRTLDRLDDDELTDELLADAWRQLALLHTRRIAHRSLDPASLLVDDEDAVHLVNLEDGDIAAGDLALRGDLAQLLATTAQRVGADRAVAAAVGVIGAERVGSAVPLLQPLAIFPSTRAAPDLLADVRDAVLRTRPEAPIEPVRLERLRTRTLVSVFGGVLAGYYLLLQFSSKQNNPLSALAAAHSGWFAFAGLAAVLGVVAATMSFVGFVPERLNLAQATLAQLAGGFANLVTPSGVGGMAVGTRFLQRAGVPPRKAIASVGASQVVGLVLHVLLILVFGYLASVHYGSSLSTSPALITGLLVAAVLALLATSVPPLRRWLAARLQPLLADVVPRLLDLLQHPVKLAVGVVGQVLVSLTSAACLYFCTLAFGLHPGFASVTVANLIGGALGSAVPTPGGVGGVEVLLSGALAQTIGVSPAEALPPVLLFRALTFWLPVLPGWLALVWLQRRKAL